MHTARNGRVDDNTYVMVSAEEHQKGRRCRGNEEEPVLGERVRVEKALALSFVTNCVLLGLGVAVDDGEIEVRGRVVLGHVKGIGAEKRMRDDRGERKRERRVASGVKLEL